MKAGFFDEAYKDFIKILQLQAKSCGRNPQLKKRNEHLRLAVKHIIASTKE